MSRSTDIIDRKIAEIKNGAEKYRNRHNMVSSTSFVIRHSVSYTQEAHKYWTNSDLIIKELENIKSEMEKLFTIEDRVDMH